MSSLAPRSKTEVDEIVRAFVKDFDRVLFSINIKDLDSWKNADWKDMVVYPAGRGYLIFATRHSEDVEKMKRIYPYSDGRFTTGIMSFGEYNSPFMEEDSKDSGEFVDWK